DNDLLTESLRQPLPQNPGYSVSTAAGRIPNDPSHWPRRIGLRPCDTRQSRHRGSARGQMQKLPSVEKFHVEAPSHLTSFDHLVRGAQQPRWPRETKRLCRFDVESRYKFGRRLHRQVSRLAAPQNAVHVVRRLAKLVHPVDRVRHETAGGDEKGVPIHRWQTMPSCERDNEVAMRIGGAVSYHDHSSFRYVARERSNSLFNIGGIILDRDEYRLDPDRRRRQLGALQIDLVIRSRLGISHEGNVCNLRLNLLEHA